MKLRPYQSRVIDELWSWFATHPDDDPIIEASVGAGKSLLIAAVARRVAAEAPGARVLVLVHQKELLEQNLDKLQRVWPGADLGIYSAALNRKSLYRQVTYATIGSVWKIAARMGRIDLVLADECHLIDPKGMGMWRKFLSDLRKYCPRMRVVGLTGTPFRGNGVWLTAEKESLFSAIATRITMSELLELGYLAPLKSVSTSARIDTSDVKIRGDDYIVSDLARITDRKDLVEATCAEILKLAGGRRRWLVFAVTVEHAEHVRDELVRLGVMADVVHAKIPKARREEIIAGHRSGEIRCLVNVAVLTTGYDVQEVDFIALLRATQSPVLYTQIAGRGMRVVGADINESIRNGKRDCIWADFTSTTEKMGPVDRIRGRMPPPKGGKSEAPFRICDNCGSRNHASAAQCTHCGFMFPPPERIKHDSIASGAAVLGREVDERRPQYAVSDVKYSIHQKPGSPASMRVDYCAGFGGLKRLASEWVAFDHRGYARMRAEAWWERFRADDSIPVPATAAEAVHWAQHGALRKPYGIQVSLEGRHPEIIYYAWEKPHDPQFDTAGQAQAAPVGDGGLHDAGAGAAQGRTA